MSQHDRTMQQITALLGTLPRMEQDQLTDMLVNRTRGAQRPYRTHTAVQCTCGAEAQSPSHCFVCASCGREIVLEMLP